MHTHMQSFLAIEDIGDSLDRVEALITKHKNFEKTLVAQEEKFKVRIVSSTILTFHHNDLSMPEYKDNNLEL